MIKTIKIAKTKSGWTIAGRKKQQAEVIIKYDGRKKNNIGIIKQCVIRAINGQPEPMATKYGLKKYETRLPQIKLWGENK
jgi:hypothetical protein